MPVHGRSSRLVVLSLCLYLCFGVDTRTTLFVDYPGDIMLGGLFPVHTTGTTNCNVINPERGIQRVEAMLFTLDEINNDTKLLPGLRLGAIIRDTCSASQFALEQALHFVLSSTDKCPADRGEGSGEKRGLNKDTPTTRGVVGSSYSSVSILVANLFRLFSIPQISYASTSAVLSDKRAFPLFARTVPSDVVQARAMATLVHDHNWTYVSTVRSAGDYGDSGMDAFWKEADKLGVCIAAREVIRINSGTEDLDAIVRVLRYDFAKARVVVLFTGMDHTKLLLDAVQRAGLVDHFVWIASDGWGRENLPVANNSRVANGALTIEIQAKPVTEFTEHYLNLGYDNPRNPWFRKYWEELFDCTFDTDAMASKQHGRRLLQTFAYRSVKRRSATESRTKPCSRDRNQRLRDRLSSGFQQEAKVQFVYNAVYAFAHGLHKLQEQLCPGNPYHPSWDKYMCIERLLNFSGTEFYETMISTSFTDKYGNHVAFDENGDGDGKYSIYNYARHPYTGQYDYRLVGDYQGNKLTMRARPIWPGGQSSELPVSQCSEECGFAEVRRLDKKQQCCWSCEPCAENQRVVNLTTCETCPLHYGPSKNRTTCVALEIHYIDIDTWFAIVPMTFSSVGICITIGVIVTWRVYSETPIVRATSRELAYLQLSGCLVSYSAPFVLLATPSVLTCTLQRIMIGLGFAMMYAALLTKTNRIARIFDAAKRTTRRPVYISPRSQLVIAGALITLQLALSAIWFGFDAPDTRIDAPRANQPNYLVRRCAMKDKSFLISLAYNVVLIIVCTAYAIKTRQIPENFNESKFIGFAMYTTCIIWLAFLPMYYATMNNHEIQITTLCISISLSASVMLSCLFIPKLYIIYFHPEKNVRRLTMNNPNAKQKIRELTQQINNASKKNSANFLVETRKDEQKEKHQSATIVTSMTNSSTRTDEQAEKSVSVHTDLDLLPNPSVISGPDKPTQFANVITNPLALVPDAAQQRQSLAKAISNNAPSNKEKQKNPTQMFSLSDIPTPTPLLLDPLSKRVTITPTYCDETTSQDEEDDYIPTRATLSYRNEHVSASIPTMSTQYAAAYSTTNSLSSVETPRSSDLYLQSLGDDTQIAPSVTSYSPSLNGGTIFTQLRQPRRSTSSRIDFTEQKVTAL